MAKSGNCAFRDATSRDLSSALLEHLAIKKN
jgi:hypothetical protein